MQCVKIVQLDCGGGYDGEWLRTCRVGWNGWLDEQLYPNNQLTCVKSSTVFLTTQPDFSELHNPKKNYRIWQVVTRVRIMWYCMGGQGTEVGLCWCS